MLIKRLDPKDLFDSSNLKTNLANKTVNGGFVTATAQGLQFILRTISTVILARLLSPVDYGLIAMAAVVTDFLGMFKDAGLSTATIQQDHITREQISTLFWINVIISTMFGLIVLASAPLLSWFYKRPELISVIAYLSLNFIFGGLTLQHNALLQRHMMFKAQRIILINSQVIGIIVTIVLAYFGYRYWSLVWGTLFTSLISILQTFYYCNWLPGKMEKGVGVRNMLKFGGHITVFDFFNYLARSGDKLLIGKFIGADALGIYSKAYGLFMLPISQIRNPLTIVALPALSALKDESDRFARYYYKIESVLATIIIPVVIYCIIETEFIIRTLLGNQWLETIPIFRVLSFCGLFQALFTTWGIVLLSMGNSKLFLKIGVVNYILTIISFSIGLQWGIKGVALSYTIYNYLSLIPVLYFAFRRTPIKLSNFFQVLIIPFFISAVSYIFMQISSIALADYQNINHIASGLLFFLSYIAFTMLRPSIRELLIRSKIDTQ